MTQIEATERRSKVPDKLLAAIPSPVKDACAVLKNGGYSAWLAGGCVRDMLLGREPRDWDIVTNAGTDKIKELFPEHVEVGVAFGIVKLIPQKDPDKAEKKQKPVEIDIAMFRHEEKYSDRRHPDSIEEGTPAQDASRRDFTINALFIDMRTAELVDFFQSQKDLGAKILRSVGDPEKRFSEDALRVLRAIRLSGQLNFKIERGTAAAVKKCASLLKEISRERVREEVFRLLNSAKPVPGLEYMAQLGLWEQVFGVKRTSLPADYRNIKVTGTPTAIDWIAGLGVCGLIGDICKDAKKVSKTLTDLLRLSRQETKLLELCFDLYEDSAKSSQLRPSPERWVTLAIERKDFIEFLKSFVRRARGPTEVQKDQALDFLEQSLRWARSPQKTAIWPTAKTLGSVAEGPKLGKLLNEKHWEVFWTRPKLDF